MSYNRSIGMTPFRALYGRDPTIVFKLDDYVSAVEEVNDTIMTSNQILAELKQHSIAA